MTWRTLPLFAAVVGTGLNSGLLFGWAVSVVPGLRQVPGQTYLSAMQSVNRAILNPVFLVPFILTPMVLAIASVTQFRAGLTPRGWLLAAACTTYVLGVLGVTFGGNVPLNNTLDALDLTSVSEDQFEARRRAFEGGWNRWHYIRTVASIVAFGLTAAAASIAVATE